MPLKTYTIFTDCIGQSSNEKSEITMKKVVPKIMFCGDMPNRTAVRALPKECFVLKRTLPIIPLLKLILFSQTV